MSMHSVQIKEDGYPDSDLAIGVTYCPGLVIISAQGDYNLPPVYLTPGAARTLGYALIGIAGTVEKAYPYATPTPAPSSRGEGEGGGTG